MKKEPANPFYFLLLIAGVLFVVTACAYGVVAVRELAPRATVTRPSGADSGATDSNGGQNLVALMNAYGLKLFAGELTLLAMGTVGAIWLDSVRQKRASSHESA